MIINSLYQTRIECSDYEVDIDSTDINVMVSLINFNNIPVPNVDVTLTVDKGYFNTKPDNTVGGTDVVSVTGKTDANGQISAVYTASEFGLATFRVNTAHAQIIIGGHRTLLETDKFTLYEFEDKMGLKCTKVFINWSMDKWFKGNENIFNDLYSIPIRKLPVTQMPYFYYSKNLSDQWCYAISFENGGELWCYGIREDTSVLNDLESANRNVYFEWIKK